MQHKGVGSKIFAALSVENIFAALQDGISSISGNKVVSKIKQMPLHSKTACFTFYFIYLFLKKWTHFNEPPIFRWIYPEACVGPPSELSMSKNFSRIWVAKQSLELSIGDVSPLTPCYSHVITSVSCLHVQAQLIQFYKCVALNMEKFN